jgi:hypothetical protein
VNGSLRVTQRVGDWILTCDLSESPRGGMTIGRLELAPRGKMPPGGGITAALLRMVNVGPVRRYAKGLNHSAPVTRRRSRAGRPKDQKTLARWRQIAKRYNELALTGTRAIDSVLARERGVPPATMRSDIHRARKAGLFDQRVIVQPAVATFSKRELERIRRRWRSARGSAHRL